MMACCAYVVSVQLEPATIICGILAKSTTRASLLMVLPNAMGNTISVFENSFVSSMLRRDTVPGLEWGTSMKMTPSAGLYARVCFPLRKSSIARATFLTKVALIFAHVIMTNLMTAGAMSILMPYIGTFNVWKISSI